MREYLDPVNKADQCAQYVDDVGVAATSPGQLTTNLRAVYKSIQNAGIKYTLEKCHFGAKEVHFLGRNNTANGVTPQKQKTTEFPKKVNF